ncbi:MAG: hypothetical protein OJF59_001277 [Cytophagales bacterium]|nr:MAG: hypothetical protein OJF59_001277 [Cytophagales bacterium]
MLSTAGRISTCGNQNIHFSANPLPISQSPIQLLGLSSGGA